MNTYISTILDNIIKSARLRLPGSIDATLKDELLYVLDDFLQHSLIWRETITVNTVTTRDEYEIEPQDANADIISLTGVTVTEGWPYAAYMPSPGLLKLHSLPSAGVTLEVTLALTISKATKSGDYPEVPEWMVSKYNQAILDGLLARMYEQPAKPYTNSDLADRHDRRYKLARTRARISSNNGNIVGGQNWVFPQAFATSRRQ